MEKVSLNKFTQVANFDYIEEPKLILSVVRKMWDIPFDEIFHAKCRYQNPTPWEYIYEEFADQEELIPKGTEAFGALPYGEIALILNEEIRRKSEAAEDMQLTKGKYKGDIYDQLEAAMDDPDTVYQWRRKYVRKNMSGVVPTLTANMGEGGHNVPLVLTHTGIRKLTAHECFNTQGFPLDFKLPSDTAESRLYVLLVSI